MSKFTKDKYFFGSVKVGERGQIVIPSKARKVFKIEPGDQLLVFGDINKGIGIMKATELKNFAMKFFEAFEINKNGEN
ncbi:MAG: AbrB/MazE/SpoVT family DNA-binding domain-containing protein [Promethearchaeota archaeon]